MYKKVKVEATLKRKAKRIIGNKSDAQSATCCGIKRIKVFERQGGCKFRKEKKFTNQKFSSPASTKLSQKLLDK